MSWKLTIRRGDAEVVREYSDGEALDLAQSLMWWAGYLETGQTMTLEITE
jgi:hypothetical protein